MKWSAWRDCSRKRDIYALSETSDKGQTLNVTTHSTQMYCHEVCGWETRSLWKIFGLVKLKQGVQILERTRKRRSHLDSRKPCLIRGKSGEHGEDLPTGPCTSRGSGYTAASTLWNSFRQNCSVQRWAGCCCFGRTGRRPPAGPAGRPTMYLFLYTEYNAQEVVRRRWSAAANRADAENTEMSPRSAGCDNIA